MSRRGLNDDLYGDRSEIRARRRGGRDEWHATFDDLGKGSEYTSFGHTRCYETHPPLVLPGDAGWKIFGGSCSTPVVKDADVYIGFDLSMRMTARSWPWKKGSEFLFHIQDMAAPTNPEEFKQLVAWTVKQLEGGAKIHAGCIGGHGRTGTFLAALVAELGVVDAITYVRTGYCHKAVESRIQVEFLGKHFGVKEVAGHKNHSDTSSKGSKKTTPQLVHSASSHMAIKPLIAGNHDRIW